MVSLIDKDLRVALDNVEDDLSDFTKLKDVIPGKKLIELAESGQNFKLREFVLGSFREGWGRFEERIDLLPSKLRADNNVLLMRVRGKDNVVEPKKDRSEPQREDAESVQ